MKKRYGKFRFRDYTYLWIVGVVLILFSIMLVIFRLNLLLVIFPIVYSVTLMLSIIIPNSEEFCIQNRILTMKKIGTTRNVTLPENITLVISLADISPPFANRLGVNRQTHILNDKYTISILQDVNLDQWNNKAHKNYVKQYTDSVVRLLFDDYRYIYSCVCDNELIDYFINNHNCLVIVPNSLKDKINLPSNINVYIDNHII